MSPLAIGGVRLRLPGLRVDLDRDAAVRLATAIVDGLDGRETLINKEIHV
ncbi:hypothetical protein ACFTSD_17565 [Nocardiaceae bacterium NPDC056970]